MRICVIPAAMLIMAPTPTAAAAITTADGAAFRAAVARYQDFVVPHCATEVVAAYVAARRGRDEAFVRSLRGTALANEYRRAVADKAAQDSNTVYECLGPPPPPGQAGDHAGGAVEQRRQTLAFFKGGDDQFATLVAIRNRLLRSATR